MRKIVIIIVIAAFLIGLVWNAQIINKNKNEKITAEKYAKMLKVGMDVDWMSFEKVNKEYFEWRDKGVNIPSFFKKEGFSNVRIRVGYDVVNNHTALIELGEIVRDCLHAGIIPIIAYDAPNFREYPTNSTWQNHFVEWWKTVAQYFKSYSYLLSYDLLIESSGAIKNHTKILNNVYNRTVSAIRSIDPYRIIILTPGDVSSPFYLKYLDVSFDKYTMVEWHIYAGGPRECKFNSTYIQNAVNTAISWSREHNVPTWVGAWRPQWYPKNGNKECNMSCVLNFSKAMVNALRSADIPYDINSDVHFFNIDNLTWIESQTPVLKVILKN